ncbi:hypothetical protein ACWDBO_37435 [Streptomyces mirabilis]|uniref:hypothetical protein n=1 Tax=Streptomyces mirabilis TaxID=68239 RepID=UPI0033312905
MKNNRRVIPAMTNHTAAAEKARLAPGVWTMVSVYRGFQSGDSVARGIRAGRVSAYRPAGTFEAYPAMHDDGTAVWARCVDGVPDITPMPQTLTVRVPNYGTQRGYEGVRITTVEISSKCQRCGGPRGPLTAHHFVKDGTPLVCDRWVNDCGHPDEYSIVLTEAQRRVDLAGVPRPKDPQVKGVEGGQFTVPVDFIALALKTKPWMRARAVAKLLEDLGHRQAAEVIRTFAESNVTGYQTSAKAAALYLIERDMGRPANATWVDGRIGYEADADTSTTTGDEK